jgi:2,3,4,5-tetrahydropyridine-2-carboxylate N-succinyltransferase
MTDIRTRIEQAYEDRAKTTPGTADVALKDAVEAIVGMLDRGEARMAEKRDGHWVVNEWLKKAVLLYFRLHPNQVSDDGTTRYYDKLPLKYTNHDASAFAKEGARIVPHAVVRRGAYIGPDVVLMPSYVNIGAYVGAGTMVDTWATIGSCAQIGNKVHISGGAGIGGVLEPLQASPTIVEDDCFIGARSEIVEGVIVEQGAVISMGVFIGQSTRIYDRESGSISYACPPPTASTASPAP